MDFMEEEMKRSIPKRIYSAEYREAAVRQVIDAGRALVEVARSLEISPKTLANWVRLARAQHPLVKRQPAVVPDRAALELSRLRAENARLRMDNEILKKAAAYFAKESL
jgi:transposase